MFNDIESESKEAEDKQSSTTMERWVLFPAIVAFGLLSLLFHSMPLRWQISIAGGYTVYVFWLALGSDKRDLDDITGDADLFRKIKTLLIPHALILPFIVLGVTEWFRLRPTLPIWAIQEGRKGSLWEMFGWLLLGLGGISEGFWLAARLRRKFGTESDFD
jgi:hypothetical protein